MSTIIIDGYEIDYEYLCPYKGYRTALWVPEEPDDYETVEINTVKLCGKDVTMELGDKYLDNLSQLIMNKLEL